MDSLTLIDINYVELAKMVAQNIPEPVTPAQNWTFAMLALSGWVVAAMLAGFYWYQVRKLTEVLGMINDTMIGTKEHIQNKDVADNVTMIKDQVLIMSTKIDNLKNI